MQATLVNFVTGALIVTITCVESVPLILALSSTAPEFGACTPRRSCLQVIHHGVDGGETGVATASRPLVHRLAKQGGGEAPASATGAVVAVSR